MKTLQNLSDTGQTNDKNVFEILAEPNKFSSDMLGSPRDIV